MRAPRRRSASTASALTNVNANAKALTPEYLTKVAALAGVFRPYGIRVYLTARFSAPIEIGGLKTADPLDPAVRALVEGEGRRDLRGDSRLRRLSRQGELRGTARSAGLQAHARRRRQHARRRASRPHGGIVMWRAFVYSNDVPTDRVKQAYDEFKPLDGQFRDNVLVQVKNGPLDFQPREPFSSALRRDAEDAADDGIPDHQGIPRRGHAPRLPRTALSRKFSTRTRGCDGKGSTVARVIDGSLHGYRAHRHRGRREHRHGSQLDRIAVQPGELVRVRPARLGSTALVRRRSPKSGFATTFSNDPEVVEPIVAHDARVARGGRELHDAARPRAHDGHGPPLRPGAVGDVSLARTGRPPTTIAPTRIGIGFERSPKGSDAVSQYAQPLRDLFGDRAQTPDSLLLWFHHVGWTERTKSGRTLWEDLFYHYREGSTPSARCVARGSRVRGKIDSARFRDVDDFLAIQEHEAVWWRDAALSYFQTFSNLPVPNGYAPFAHPLSFYRALRCPAGPPGDLRAFTALDSRKPRCPAVY